MVILGKKLNFLVIFWFLFYFFVFGLLLRNSFDYLDPDLGWHLKVGEEIAQTGTLPHLNIYNYTFTGNWVDHEWLINLISFEIYSKLGYFSLNIFFALVIIFSLFLFNIYTRKFFPQAPGWLLAFLQLFGLIACLPHFGVRMQEFGFLFLLLELWIITEFNYKRKWPRLLWLWPLFYLWSNIHGSFLLGLGILFIWPLVKLTERYLVSSKWRKYFSEAKVITAKEAKIFFIFFLGSLFVTLLTPYGLELYTFLGEYSNTFYLGAIQEWTPQFNFPFNYWQLLYLAWLSLALGLYFYNLVYKKIAKIDLWQLSLVFLFLILSFKSRRHFPLMFVATFPFLIQTVYDLLDLEKIKHFLIRKELKYVFLICLGLVGVNQYISFSVISNPFNYFCAKYPCQATEFLKKEVQYKNLNIFNEYNWGGYLIWVYPEKKLFIDGRIPQTEYAGQTFLEEYLDFLSPQSDYAAKLDQYNIKLILIKTKDNKIKARNLEKIFLWIQDKDLTFPNYLRRYLDSSPDWQKIYSDPLASIYLKIKE